MNSEEDAERCVCAGLREGLHYIMCKRLRLSLADEAPRSASFSRERVKQVKKILTEIGRCAYKIGGRNRGKRQCLSLAAETPR